MSIDYLVWLPKPVLAVRLSVRNHISSVRGNTRPVIVL